MELRFQAGGPESWSADAVIVFLSEDEKLEKAYPELLDAAPWMSIAPGMRDFHGKKGEMGLLYGPPAHPLSRAVVVGLGKLDALTYAETLEEIRKGAGAAAVRCRELGVDTLALPVSGLARFNADVERTIEEIVCAAMLGLWRNKAFKSKEPEDADPRWLALLFCDANVRTSPPCRPARRDPCRSRHPRTQPCQHPGQQPHAGRHGGRSPQARPTPRHELRSARTRGHRFPRHGRVRRRRRPVPPTIRA